MGNEERNDFADAYKRVPAYSPPRCPVCDGPTFFSGPDGPAECSIQCRNTRASMEQSNGE